MKEHGHSKVKEAEGAALPRCTVLPCDGCLPTDSWQRGGAGRAIMSATYAGFVGWPAAASSSAAGKSGGAAGCRL
jgi:hypothetical protein